MSLKPRHTNNLLKDILNKHLSSIDIDFQYWLENRLNKVSGIEAFLKERAEYADNLITTLWNGADLSKERDLTLFAVGGYGRKELHPYSDIDLLIIYRKKLKLTNQKKN